MNSLSSSIFSSTTFHLTKNPSKINHNNRSSLNISMSHLPKRRCDFYDLHKEIVPYTKAWSWQKQIVDQRKKNLNDDFADTLIILQHQPVYTLGTGSSEEFLNFDVNNPPIDLYRTERGGQVSYHGPGQLVMYPILNLRYYELDLHWYLRALEEVVIRALSSAFDIEASRVEGLTGDQKLAAIGIKGSGWITYYGLALNVTTDMTPFKRIVPCGIHDRQVGSIKGLLTESFSNKECGEEVCYRFEDTKLIDITHKAMVREFCEVFQVDLQYRSMKSSCRIDDLLLHPH